MDQDNLVGIVARPRFAQQNNRGLIQFPTRTTDFLFSKTFNPALWPSRPPTLCRGNDIRRKAAGAWRQPFTLSSADFKKDL